MDLWSARMELCTRKSTRCHRIFSGGLRNDGTIRIGAGEIGGSQKRGSGKCIGSNVMSCFYFISIAQSEIFSDLVY